MTKMALEGLRVADFTWAWAGPYATMLFTDMGAEVINIETHPRTSNLRVQPPFPGGQLDGVNSGGWWSSSYRGKLSCTLNLKHPKGLEIAKRIVAISDIAAENFSPGVMERLGLSYKDLKPVKPDIIYISMSGYGATGPESTRISYGNHIASSAGLIAITGFPDSAPSQILIPYPDPIGGLTGAFAVLSALHYRSRTGRGQYIDLSQAEAMACLIPEALMEYTMNRRNRPRAGNRDDCMAPHGCYPCREEDDRVAIAVSSDDEWKSFCEAIGSPDWTGDEKFSDGFGRFNHQDELDELVAGWTRRHTSYQIMEILQRVGVAATPVLNGADMVNDPHLRERGVFVEDMLPAMGKKLMAGPSWRMSHTPGKVGGPAPLLGEHNEYVFGELLGMSKDEIAELVEEEAIT
jgi:benzylsuccinate CoA-transferase BbsF subunit